MTSLPRAEGPELSRPVLDAMREWAARDMGSERWYGDDASAIRYVENWFTDKPTGGVSAFLAEHGGEV